RAMDRPFSSAGIQGIYSPIQKFVWEPEWFSEVKPAHGATLTTPTFSWKSTVAADEFRVSVRNTNGRTVASGTTHANRWTPVNAELDPAEGPFEWDLTAYTADGTSSLIRGRRFSLTDTAAGTPDASP